MSDWRPPNSPLGQHEGRLYDAPEEESSQWGDFWGGAIAFAVAVTICLLILAWAGVL